MVETNQQSSGAPSKGGGDEYMHMPDDNNNEQSPPSGTKGTKLGLASRKKSGRRGHLFCGKCCDMRIATVVLNIINLLILVIGGIFSVVRHGWPAIGAHFPGLVLSCVGIYGALNFEFWAVCLATVGYCAGILFDVFWLNWIGLCIGIIIVYPHIVLCNEIQKGIMTRENYQKEEYIDPGLASNTGLASV